MAQRNRITYSRANGDWGIEGVNLVELPPVLYRAVLKLKDYENTGLSPQECESYKRFEEEVIAKGADFDALLTAIAEAEGRMKHGTKENKA